DPNTEINHALKQVAPNFPELVASVIAKTYPNPQVVKMISSQADADRMDYLQRDAYFTGVNYGRFDLSRILRVSVLIKMVFVLPTMGCMPLKTISCHAIRCTNRSTSTA